MLKSPGTSGRKEADAAPEAYYYRTSGLKNCSGSLDRADSDLFYADGILDEELDNYYYRAPRFKHDVDTFELKLDPPPAKQNGDEMPLAMVIGPSMTMGIAALATGTFAVISALNQGDFTSAIPSIIMSVSMLLGTMLWPMITRTYQRRLNRKKEAKRQESYQAYLAQMESILAQETFRQEQILLANDVEASVCASRILAETPEIWERTRKHTDFLSLRIGCGQLPLKANIQQPERRFSVEQDNLAEAVYQFGETPRWLSGVPICLPLTQRYICGIYGPRALRLACARRLILETVALHGYDEVKLALICSEADDEYFSFLRWLPFTMDQETSTRYVATNSDEVKVLSSSLDVIIEQRKAMSQDALEEESPYYVIVCLDKELSSRAECVRRILEHKDNLRFSVLSVFERLQDLPKECSAVVELRDTITASLTLIQDVSDPPLFFHLDQDRHIDMQQVTRVLANTQIDLGSSTFHMPSKYTFLEMLGIGMIEHLNLIDRWAANDPTKSLGVPIGIDKYGELFKLDLHERAHGPHGLVAGMTGSGKSEMIISYILSMAVHFHPYEVAFILIDYKGGGMASPFANIPHTAGIITNLDSNGIQRALASMRSELHRREKIFQETTQRCHVSNIDIYKYQKLYREGKVTQPLPHLFVISDEFAELKKDQPEFMSELTSTARVGRSLGVHLILATQKPGGVVDDQIRSNSRFRLCLKVQEAGDSIEMLNRPEAAALVETGRFYLQVGYNEIFEIGQSAWSGAPYYPSSRVIQDQDDAVSVIDTNGRTIAEANIDRFAAIRDPQKQLDAVTSYIQQVCQDEGIQRWKMWLDPIPERIYVDRLVEKYAGVPRAAGPFDLAPVVGEYDDPSHQSQGLLWVPLSAGGNAIIYGSAGSGKAMFLEAMCYSLLKEHKPSEVNLYLLDFGAETLTAFRPAPHVGDIILASESEKVERLFRQLLRMLNTRKKLLSRYGGDMAQYNSHAEDPVPNVVVIINNFAAFTELFEEKSPELNLLTREGTKYGIYFVLTCTGINNVRLNLRQNFKCIYCLQLNQVDDYASVVGKTGGLYPEPYEGRGLIQQGKSGVLEFQTACVCEDDLPTAFIQQFAKDLADLYADARAAAVPTLPERVTESFLASYVTPGDLSTLPIGVEKESLEICRWDVTAEPVHLLLSQNREWQAPGEAITRMVAGRCGVETWAFFPDGKTGLKSGENLTVFTDAKSCAQGAKRIYQTVLQRNNQYKDLLASGAEMPEFSPVFIYIASMSALKVALDKVQPPEAEREATDDTPLNRIQVAMEKCSSDYKVYFLVAESITPLTPFTATSWYKAQINGSRGLWVGGGIGSQFRLNLSKKPAGADGDSGPDSGFAVVNSVATAVKFLCGDKGAPA